MKITGETTENVEHEKIKKSHSTKKKHRKDKE